MDNAIKRIGMNFTGLRVWDVMPTGEPHTLATAGPAIGVVTVEDRFIGDPDEESNNDPETHIRLAASCLGANLFEEHRTYAVELWAPVSGPGSEQGAYLLFPRVTRLSYARAAPKTGDPVPSVNLVAITPNRWGVGRYPVNFHRDTPIGLRFRLGGRDPFVMMMSTMSPAAAMAYTDHLAPRLPLPDERAA